MSDEPTLPPVVVLLLGHARIDPHARSALRAYAASLRTEQPAVARHVITVLNGLPRRGVR